MQIDKTMLDQLLSFDDQTLARTISLLADAAGIERNTTNAALHDLRGVRSALSNASNADIQKAVSLLGEERAMALLTMLKNNGR